MRWKLPIVVAVGVALTTAVVAATTVAPTTRKNASGYLFNDSHVHLTNYVQEGSDVRTMLAVMGDKVGRAALFGIPLQQMWSHRMSGYNAPTYYLDSDSELYYYSFTDAQIALAYQSLSEDDKARFDPMITGFNPADMYAADHVRRVLELFPNTFVGIGEFSLHKEFVTAKLAGERPSLDDAAVDRLFDFAGEVGLVVLVHCDVDTPFPREGEDPAYLPVLHELFKRHADTTFIWAHIGLGRIVRPVEDQLLLIDSILENPRMTNVNFDISWAETAKYLTATPATTKAMAEMITRHPTRFLFGTDEVAPSDQHTYLRVYRQYEPLWNRLPAEVLDQVTKGNYARLFDDARRKVRAWEVDHRERQRLLDVP